MSDKQYKSVSLVRLAMASFSYEDLGPLPTVAEGLMALVTDDYDDSLLVIVTMLVLQAMAVVYAMKVMKWGWFKKPYVVKRTMTKKKYPNLHSFVRRNK